MNKWRGWIWTLALIGADSLWLFGIWRTDAERNLACLVISIAFTLYIWLIGEWWQRKRFKAVRDSRYEDGGRIARLAAEFVLESEKRSLYRWLFPARVYVIPGEEREAYAVGKETIMVTEAALQMEDEELQALLEEKMALLETGHGCMALMMLASFVVLSIGYWVLCLFVAMAAAGIWLLWTMFGFKLCFYGEIPEEINVFVRMAVQEVKERYAAARRQVVAWSKCGSVKF